MNARAIIYIQVYLTPELVLLTMRLEPISPFCLWNISEIIPSSTSHLLHISLLILRQFFWPPCLQVLLTQCILQPHLEVNFVQCSVDHRLSMILHWWNMLVLHNKSSQFYLVAQSYHAAIDSSNVRTLLHIYPLAQNIESVLISLHSPDMFNLLVLSYSVQTPLFPLSQLL